MFRNYVPTDDVLKETVLESAKPGNVEEEIKDQLEAANSRVIIEDLVRICLQLLMSYCKHR